MVPVVHSESVLEVMVLGDPCYSKVEDAQLLKMFEAFQVVKPVGVLRSNLIGHNLFISWNELILI